MHRVSLRTDLFINVELQRRVQSACLRCDKERWSRGEAEGGSRALTVPPPCRCMPVSLSTFRNICTSHIIPASTLRTTSKGNISKLIHTNRARTLQWCRTEMRRLSTAQAPLASGRRYSRRPEQMQTACVRDVAATRAETNAHSTRHPFKRLIATVTTVHIVTCFFTSSGRVITHENTKW